MTEKPILFSAPMVRAILDANKTQTRRVIDMVFADFSEGELVPHGRPIELRDGVLCEFMDANDISEKKWMPAREPQPGWIPIVAGVGPKGEGNPVRCPYGQPGDRLWVRETWTPQDGMTMEARELDTIIYRADGEVNKGEYPNWRPSIFMPRWASRITLEITGVRVERVNEISEEDAKAEGAIQWWIESDRDRLSDSTARCAFKHLWDSINVKRGFGWKDNCWVWALTFKVI